MNRRFLSVMLLLVVSKTSTCENFPSKKGRHKRHTAYELPQIHSDIRKAHEEKIAKELSEAPKVIDETPSELVELSHQGIELITQQEISANSSEQCIVIITPETDDLESSIAQAKNENSEDGIYLSIQPDIIDEIELQVIKPSWKDKITKSKEPNLPSHNPEEFKEFKIKLSSNLDGIVLTAKEMAQEKEEKREFKKNVLDLIPEVVKAKQLSQKDRLLERLEAIYGKTSNTKLAHLMIQLSKNPTLLSDEQLEKKILLDCAEKLKSSALNQHDSYVTSHTDHGNLIDFHLPLPAGKTEELNELRRRLAIIENMNESTRLLQAKNADSLSLNGFEYLKTQKAISDISKQIESLQNAKSKLEFDSRSHRISSIIAASSKQDFDSENIVIDEKISELKQIILDKSLAIEKESLPTVSPKKSWFSW